MEQAVIDFHVHPFRDRAHCLNFYPERAGFSMEDMVSEVKSAGITHICGSVLNRENIQSFHQVHALNLEALALGQRLGRFYTPGFHVHPKWIRESCQEAEEMYRAGVRLLGELVPYMHGWEAEEAPLMEILEAVPRGILCSYHTPTDLPMELVIAAYPEITFVAAHPGDRDRVETHIALMRRYDNLYLDLSGTGLFRLGLVKHLVEQVGAERILFGSDYPICNPKMYVQAVLFENISSADKEKILFGNANRLLFLKN